MGWLSWETFQCKTHCNKAMDDCISETLFKQMADKMFFDYELVLPSDESDDFGKRSKDGGWSGLIGDLVSGEVDIAVAAMTMTSEREEAVDFVAPYFDQSGISILLRFHFIVHAH